MKRDDKESATTSEEALSPVEMQIEQEKLRLERERMLLERERLESTCQRIQIQRTLQDASKGRLTVNLTSLVLISIICTLTGGILGAFMATTHAQHHRAVRLQEVMQTLAASAPEADEGGMTNRTTSVKSTELPGWMKTMQPKGAYSGISLVVIQ